jgi:hypothetical protein
MPFSLNMNIPQNLFSEFLPQSFFRENDNDPFVLRYNLENKESTISTSIKGQR